MINRGLLASSTPLLRLSLRTAAAVAICFGMGLSASAKPVKAEKADSSTALSPEALGAKAFLEDLLARRYSQELATMIEKDSFSLGAQLDLSAIVPPATPPPAQKNDPKAPGDFDPLSDLMLGSLDAESLLKSYMGAGATIDPDKQPAVQRLLGSFRIKAVTLSVGLKESLDPAVKNEVETWLKKRVTAEFGKTGKSTVAVIRTPLKKVEPPAAPPNYWDMLDQFQSLAGQVVIAVAIILGTLLWKGSSAGSDAGFGSSEDSSDMEALQAAAAEVAADNAKMDDQNALLEESDRVRLTSELELLRRNVIDLVPRLAGYLDDVVRNWCHMGDGGRLRLACFAEIAGKETGKLPIPIDALQDVQRIFAKMPEISMRDKREALQKAYWDLLSTLNLGSESLSQPFSYLDGINVNMVNRMLVGQNPRLRTVVSLYMNDEMRTRYIQGLSPKAKKEMLESAAALNEIRSDELETLDRSIHVRLNPAHGQEIVPLEFSFNKIVNAIPVMEAIPILSDMKGDAIDEYKRTVPSLAFLREWPDDKIQMLLMGVTPDELISYLRLVPDQKERFLAVASMMVGEIATEELNRPDKMTPADKIRSLEFFTQRLKDMTEQGDINLEEIFGLSMANQLAAAAATANDEPQQDDSDANKNAA